MKENVGVKRQGRLVLEPNSEDLEDAVEEWVQQPRGRAGEASVEEASESWKWMSREYARKKLGLS